MYYKSYSKEQGSLVPKRFAVAFTGPSNSGKTTLIVKVAQMLIGTHEVAIIKNDPKDKAIFDVEGKDSYLFSQTGAEVVVASPARTTLFSRREKSLEEMVEMVGDFDYLLVEGLKTLPLPRIAVFRGRIEPGYLNCSEAIAVDGSIDISAHEIPGSIAILDLNNTQEILSWIYQHAKELP
jgi:molybdopterin-guanine dinucleotide biosynthesis adapter protein